MSDKILYFVLDNGDYSITTDLLSCMELIKSEMEEYNDGTPEEDLPVFTLSPVYMTKEEFDSMPEADV